jgi:hypothetical protein
MAGAVMGILQSKVITKDVCAKSLMPPRKLRRIQDSHAVDSLELVSVA